MRGPWASLAVAIGLLCPSFVSAYFPLLERADNSSTPASTNSSTFVFHYGNPGSVDTGNFTFTIAVNPVTRNTWFRLAAPSDYSYVAVGTGAQMKDSTMFIFYEGAKPDDWQMSIRNGHGNVEPIANKSMSMNRVEVNNDPHPNGIRDGYYYAAWHCLNCADQIGINPTSKNQGFIWALGPPGHSPRSNDVEAPLRMHRGHGYFGLDMTKAVGKEMPPLGTASEGVVTQNNKLTLDHDAGSPGHAAVMGLAFVVVFPLGVLALRVLDKVKLHMVFQSIGLLLVLLGFGSGLYISRVYNRSKGYNTAHQIIGLIVVFIVITQWVLGFLHHRTFVKTQRPTAMIKPHKWILGPLVMLLGLVNGGLGFRLAVNPAFNLIYAPLVIAMLILMSVALALKRVFGNRRRKVNPPMFGGEAPNVPYDPPQGGYAPAPYGSGPATYGSGPTPYAADSNYAYSNRSDIALHTMGDPPAYSTQPTKPRDVI
ncbi:hypothetical protein EJ06DRAFT_546243 [Trichodelitschia bisporula]|uniref:Cytochrome b561 domain-containing protein n=1 Tax=Trichodelitschia bisporula TaxID=703511 RepID=A0A6G1I869_9PEZI|nr:hypothetical protein EJ06DRAFT_546243 [Trichodelitschia bisporula]